MSKLRKLIHTCIFISAKQKGVILKTGHFLRSFWQSIPELTMSLARIQICMHILCILPSLAPHSPSFGVFLTDLSSILYKAITTITIIFVG